MNRFILAIISILICFVVIGCNVSSHISGEITSEEPLNTTVMQSAYKPAVMVNDLIYWLSGYIEDSNIKEIPEHFSEYGVITDIKKQPPELSDCEALTLTVGLQIYSSEEDLTCVYVYKPDIEKYLRFIDVSISE